MGGPAYAESRGWIVVEVLQDAAISGASSFRPGYQTLLERARENKFDIVVSEALDRLSRDQSDVAGLNKRLSFAGIAIHTVSEGLVTELHVGLKGTMNALFLKFLAAKTHRGLRGRVEAGKSGGGLCYGYQLVRQIDDRGEQVRGDRRIHPEQHPIVTQIFKMFAAGSSPIAIAKALNLENTPGPFGRAWRDTTIRGHREPEACAEVSIAFRQECARAEKNVADSDAGRHRELEKVRNKLDELVDAIASGLRSTTLQAKLAQLESRQAELQQTVASPAHLLRLRSLIERVVITPASGGTGSEVELVGELTAMINLAVRAEIGVKRQRTLGLSAAAMSSVQVVAGTRNCLDLLLTG